MVENVTERVLSKTETDLMRFVASSYDNNVVFVDTGNDELISAGTSLTILGEKAKILGGIGFVFTAGLPSSSSDLLEQENVQLRKENLILRDTIRRIEERLSNIEASLPRQKVVILRELSKEEAKDEIKGLFSSGKTLYYSDIAQQLRLDLELVVDICDELQEQGDITIDAGVS